MITFNRSILSALTLCAVCMNSSMLVGQQFVPPGNRDVPLPRMLESTKVEAADKIDEKMFPDGLFHDVGTAPSGTLVYHTFRIVNTSKVSLKIDSVRSFSSAAAWTSKNELEPNEAVKLKVAIDTRRFVGVKTANIYVHLNDGKITEHRFVVQATSCHDQAFFPESLRFFGKITRGDTPTTHMIVTVPDQPKLQVTEATCDSKFIQVKVQELARGATRAVYQVSATLRADIPAGELYSQVELSTNNPAMPKLSVPISVAVEAAK